MGDIPLLLGVSSWHRTRGERVDRWLTTLAVMTPTGHDPAEQEDILQWVFG